MSTHLYLSLLSVPKSRDSQTQVMLPVGWDGPQAPRTFILMVTAHTGPPLPTLCASICCMTSSSSALLRKPRVDFLEVLHWKEISHSFQMNQLFTSGSQSIGASASTSGLPVNIQDGFPLEWTGWISLQSKGLSRVLSNTTVQKLYNPRSKK